MHNAIFLKNMRGARSIHLFVFALADFFELGETGGLGSIMAAGG